MTDIADRLRQGVDPHEGIPETEAAMDRGADEIERLRTERQVLLIWMREPDYVEHASLEWLIEWVNRRPGLSND